MVSIHRGLLAESPNAFRNRCTALFRLCSKSTKVLDGQSCWRSSSLVRVSLGRCSRSNKSLKACWSSFTFRPCFRSSLVRGLISKTPKRMGETGLERLMARTYFTDESVLKGGEKRVRTPKKWLHNSNKT